jgi:PadR family transcriptional regulator
VRDFLLAFLGDGPYPSPRKTRRGTAATDASAPIPKGDLTASGASTMLMTRELLPGTLDMLILKALSLGPTHGYGVLLRIESTSRGLLTLEQGSLYPALARLEHRKLVSAEWGVSENSRRARFYRLTEAGLHRLEGETDRWARMVSAVSNVLDALQSEA